VPLASSEETSGQSAVSFSYAVSTLGVYLLEVSTWLQFETGAYSVTVSPFAAAPTGLVAQDQLKTDN